MATIKLCVAREPPPPAGPLLAMLPAEPSAPPPPSEDPFFFPVATPTHNIMPVNTPFLESCRLSRDFELTLPDFPFPPPAVLFAVDWAASVFSKASRSKVEAGPSPMATRFIRQGL